MSRRGKTRGTKERAAGTSGFQSGPFASWGVETRRHSNNPPCEIRTGLPIIGRHDYPALKFLETNPPSFANREGSLARSPDGYGPFSRHLLRSTSDTPLAKYGIQLVLVGIHIHIVFLGARDEAALVG